MSIHSAFWTTLETAGFVAASKPGTYTYDEERAMNNAKSITQWSTESDSLKAMMLHERKNGKTRNAASIYGFVLNLFLDNKGIHDCDATLLNFNRLTELHISNNKLSELRNLPPTLQILHAYGNRLRSVDFNATRALVHVGLGYNAFSGVHLPMFKPLRASLVSLDLSANEFCDLDELLKALVKFPQLRHLYLMGNPICMRRNYRRAVVSALPALLLLDGIEIGEEERLASSSSPADNSAPPPITLSVRLESLSGLAVEPDEVTERALYKVLSALPEWKEKAAEAATAAKAPDAPAPIMAMLCKKTSYHVQFRLSEETVYRSADLDSTAAGAVAPAAAAAAPAKVDPKAKPAAPVAPIIAEPVTLPLDVLAEATFEPSIVWRNFFSLNLLHVFLMRREVTRPVVDEAAAAPTDAPSDALPTSTSQLTEQQLDALTKVSEKIVGIARVETSKFLDARRSELSISLTKRFAFYQEKPLDLHPAFERLVPAEVSAPDQPAPRRTRLDSSVKVLLRMNMSAEEAAAAGGEEESDAA